MRTLVIGYGSIGSRHARLLHKAGHEVRCVTRNPECPFPVHADIREAVDALQPGLAVVATPTGTHLAGLTELLCAGYSGRILMEKPLFDQVPDASAPLLIPSSVQVYTAYNLRFHPLVIRAREVLEDRQTACARFHVGQYLPDWRPGTDYRKSYSASRAQGGGVLRDLSHELDMAQHLLGPWVRATAILGTFGGLDIDSDDTCDLLVQLANCPSANIHLDYLNRVPRRGFDILTADMSLRADFMAGTLDINGRIEHFSPDRDHTYREQLRDACSDMPSSRLCTLDQGMETVRLITALEHASNAGTWAEHQ